MDGGGVDGVTCRVQMVDPGWIAPCKEIALSLALLSDESHPLSRPYSWHNTYLGIQAHKEIKIFVYQAAWKETCTHSLILAPFCDTRD